jgi:hypothetical protein
VNYVERVDVGDSWEKLINELNYQGLCECPWIVFEPWLQKTASGKPKSLSKNIMSNLLFDNVSWSLVYKHFKKSRDIRMILNDNKFAVNLPI